MENNSYSMVQMDAQTYRLEDAFVRCFLLIGEEKALWIDSGVSGLDLLEIAKEVTDLPVMLLNTHSDGDHTAGNGVFREFYMTQKDYDVSGLREKIPESKCVPVVDGDVIELGSRLLEVMEIPGHTEGSIAILDVTGRRLYAGDTVQKDRIFLFGENRRPDLFADALKKVIRFQGAFDEIAASHGEVLLPGNYAEKVLEAWEAVQKGKVPAGKEDFFGTEVTCYETQYCGFLC